MLGVLQRPASEGEPCNGESRRGNGLRRTQALQRLGGEVAYQGISFLMPFFLLLDSLPVVEVAAEASDLAASVCVALAVSLAVEEELSVVTAGLLESAAVLVAGAPSVVAGVAGSVAAGASAAGVFTSSVVAAGVEPSGAACPG